MATFFFKLMTGFACFQHFEDCVNPSERLSANEVSMTERCMLGNLCCLAHNVKDSQDILCPIEQGRGLCGRTLSMKELRSKTFRC